MNMWSPFFGLASAVVLVAQAPSPSQIPTTIQNGFFGEGEFGQMPKGWKIPKPVYGAGFRGELVEDTDLPGKRAILFSHEMGNSPMGHFGQTISAKLFQGKRIRLRSKLRLEASRQSGAMLWLKVNRSNQQNGFTDNMAFRPVTQPTWTNVEIIGDVAPDAESIDLGAILNADRGKMWVAPFAFDVLGDTPKIPLEKPMPLTSQGLQNLVAFSKAFNYIRFFHPSDEASVANWNRLAIKGMRAVEGVSNTLELARYLRSFFAPYAPSVQFLLDGEKARHVFQPANATRVVRWVHMGFWEKDPRAPYRSQLEFLPLDKWKEKGWEDPCSLSKFPLVKGLTICLPTVCFANAETTLPLPRPTTQSSDELPEPTTEDNLTGDDRATRIGDIGLAWGVLQHFYPYFDVTDAHWDAELIKALKSAAMDVNSFAFSHTLRRLVAALHDGHGRVLGEGEFGQYMPALVITMVGGEPVVSSSTGSANAVIPGSRILSVDGEPVSGLMQHLEEEISAATQGWMNAQLSMKLLSGKQGSKVRLRIENPSGKEEEVCLPRDSFCSQPKDARLPAPLAEPRPGVYYVDLDRITEKSFKEALQKLAEAKGVVFDLRGYPKISPDFFGYLTEKPLEVGGGAIPIVTKPDRVGWTWKMLGTWKLQPTQPRIKGRVVFLCGGGTLSQAEGWMEIVEANNLAAIVGEPSGGTNGNINRIHLPGNYQIIWTGVNVSKRDGSRHHGVGIRPTILVSPTLKGITEGRDEVLEKGLDVAGGARN